MLSTFRAHTHARAHTHTLEQTITQATHAYTIIHAAVHPHTCMHARSARMHARSACTHARAQPPTNLLTHARAHAHTQHIRAGCPKAGGASKKNGCSMPGCKEKEFIPVSCKLCKRPFCLKHRFETVRADPKP